MTGVSEFCFRLDEAEIKKVERRGDVPAEIELEIRQIEEWRDLGLGSERHREAAAEIGVPLDEFYNRMIEDRIRALDEEHDEERDDGRFTERHDEEEDYE